MKKLTTAHRLAIAGSVLLVLGALAPILWTTYARNELAKAKQRCRDAGLPMTIDDLRPKPVPDEDNAALVLKELTPKLNSLRNSSAFDSLFPLIGRLEHAGVGFLLSREQAAELEAAFAHAEVREVLSLIELAASKPAFNANLAYEKRAKMENPHPELFLEVLRFRTWEARLAAYQRKPEEALRLVASMVKFFEHLKDEPLVLSQLTRAGGIRKSLAELERLSGAMEIPRVSSERFSNELDRITWMEEFARGFDGERLLMGDYAFEVVAASGRPGFESSRDWIYRAPGFSLLEHAAYTNRVYEGRKVVAETSDFGAINRELGRPLDVPRWMGIIRIVLPSLRWLVVIGLQADAKVRLARIGLALERFKAARGVYPAMLDELTPEFLAEVPLDFFSGKSFIYVRDADGRGALVYSVGPNQRDEGGVRDDSRGASTGPDDESWVCGEAAQRKFAAEDALRSAEAGRSR